MSKVIIVAGFGRCGTSLMMQMLAAGGVACVGHWPAFEDWRCDASMSLTAKWLSSNAGRAVKILDPHRCRDDLSTVDRIVIWMDRNSIQQARSQVKFGRIIGGLPILPSAWKAFRRSIESDRPRALASLQIGKCPFEQISFESLLADPPGRMRKLSELLTEHGFTLNIANAVSALRPRDPECLPGFLEAELLDQFSNTAGAQ